MPNVAYVSVGTKFREGKCMHGIAKQANRYRSVRLKNLSMKLRIPYRTRSAFAPTQIILKSTLLAVKARIRRM